MATRMKKNLFALAVEVESHQFWLNRPTLRKRMGQVFSYIKNLEVENEQLKRELLSERK